MNGLDAMEIKSAHSNTCLRFHSIEDDYFRASLTGIACSGEVRIWADPYVHGTDGVFESLAQDWRGWVGDRHWSSVEGEFLLNCRHDGLGHITFDIKMIQGCGTCEPWQLNACLVVDACQLDSIAKDAKKFFGPATLDS